MKKCLAVITLILAVSAASIAQVPQVPFSIYAGGLFSVPDSPTEFKDSYKNGFHGFVGLGFKMVPALQFVGKVEYHSFKFDFTDWGPETTPSGGTQGIWLYGVDAVASANIPGAPIKPYVLAGGGMSRVAFSEFSSDVILTAPENQSKFYYNFGGGVQMKLLPSVDLFAQVRYVSIATDDKNTSLIPISVGVKIF